MLTLLVFGCVHLAGCWDRVEIDQRGFVVGVGIDMPAEQEDAADSQDTSLRYRGTYQIIKPSGLASTNGGSSGSTSGSGSGSRGQQEASFNISAEEASLPAISARISTIAGRSPYFEHLQLIILSAAIARKPNAVTDVLDYFLRDVEMRRDIKVMVTPGSAADVLKATPLNEKYPTAYLKTLSENTKNSSYMMPATRIGDLHESLLKKDGYTVQLVSSEGRNVSLDGAAVFEGMSNLLLGYLDGPGAQALSLLRGETEGGILQTRYDGGTIDIELEFAQHRIEADIRSPRDMTFTITVTVEGMMEKSTDDRRVDKEPEIIAMQKKFEEDIELNCRKTIKKLQNTIKEDVIGLGPWLRRNHYGIWKEIREEWNESIFPNVEINVNAVVEIRRMGNIVLTNEAGRVQ